MQKSSMPMHQALKNITLALMDMLLVGSVFMEKHQGHVLAEQVLWVQ